MVDGTAWSISNRTCSFLQAIVLYRCWMQLWSECCQLCVCSPGLIELSGGMGVYAHGRCETCSGNERVSNSVYMAVIANPIASLVGESSAHRPDACACLVWATHICEMLYHKHPGQQAKQVFGDPSQQLQG